MSLLFSAFGPDFVGLPILSLLGADADEINFVKRMILNDSGCINTSSSGRIFDGFAALMGVCSENHFEAQAAMALESAAARCDQLAPFAAGHFFELVPTDGQLLIDFAPLVREVVRRSREPVPELAALVHEQFVAAWEAAIVRAVDETALTTVVLSGGTFCNQIVANRLADRLTRRGLEVLDHHRVPPNDGGLALGQAAVAAHRFARDASL
jgi:hydrogenase maturation protein HypF